MLNFKIGAEFLELFGTALHISNDICDICIPENNCFKKSQDIFSDLKNDRLNLVYYFALNENPTLRKFIGKEINGSNYEEILTLIKTTSSIKKSLVYNKRNLNSVKKFLHLHLKDNSGRDSLSYLSSVIATNKNLHSLHTI